MIGMRVGWRCALLGIGMLAPSCGGGDGSYDASVAAIRDDVRLVVRVDGNGGGRLILERWRWGHAFDWEHCPRVHARASVNGRALVVSESGHWLPPSGTGGILSGGGADCAAIVYRFGAETLGGLTGDVVFRVEDESAQLELVTPYLGSRPSLEVVTPSPTAIVPGQRAEVALLPAASILDASACRLTFSGARAKKTIAEQFAAFTIASADLARTERGFAFVVPNAADSFGALRLDCGNAWRPNVTRCNVGPGCSVDRSDIHEVKLDVSVSATGERVTPDATTDPAGWNSCWFSAVLSGAVDSHVELLDPCSGGFQPSQKKLSFSWGGASPPTFSLRIAGIDALTPLPALKGTLEARVRDGHWASAPDACDLTVDQVEPPSGGRNAYVLQGTGSCGDGLSPVSGASAPLQVPSFRFRAVAGVFP
jgi:hypothetical protein